MAIHSPNPNSDVTGLGTVVVLFVLSFMSISLAKDEDVVLHCAVVIISTTKITGLSFGRSCGRRYSRARTLATRDVKLPLLEVLPGVRDRSGRRSDWGICETNHLAINARDLAGWSRNRIG
jgi:hypothetical protein